MRNTQPFAQVRMSNGTLAPMFALARRPYQEPASRHSLGRMDHDCPSCGALHWSSEQLAASSQHDPKYGICCNSGQVQLPLLRDPPQPLKDLFTSDHDDAKEFRENVWKYNRAFAFTSMYAEEDQSVNRGRGPPVFRILGELYHRGGSLEPERGQRATHAQLYV
ncbi:hypothetical protein DFP72DRAFT_1143182, partial [Ephemerocybe angulata]